MSSKSTPMTPKNCNRLLKCNNPKRTVFIKGTYPIMECTRCKHRYSPPPATGEAHIKNVYNTDYFFGGEDGYSNYLDHHHLLITRGRKYARLIHQYTRPGQILDVGAACGFILKGFEMEGWTGTGIEPNKGMVTYGKEHLQLNLVDTPLEEFRANGAYDLVTLIQVIGHFYDLDKSLQVIRKHLNKQGLVLIESWDRRSLMARILGRKWHEYNPPSVLHWYSKKTLTGLMRQHGFEPVAFGRPQKKISTQHLLSYLKYRTANRVLRSLLNKIARSKFTNKNILYPPMDIFWALYRKKR